MKLSFYVEAFDGKQRKPQMIAALCNYLIGRQYNLSNQLPINIEVSLKQPKPTIFVSFSTENPEYWNDMLDAYNIIINISLIFCAGFLANPLARFWSNPNLVFTPFDSETPLDKRTILIQ